MGRAPELVTERLLLRRWLPDDLEPYAALNADPVVMEHFPSTSSRAREPSRHRDLRSTFRRARVWPLGGRGTRRCAVHRVHRTQSRDVRCCRSHPRSKWGGGSPARTGAAGYATEGARAALRFGFDTVGLDEIVSFTSPRNVRSWHVMEKIGMSRDPADDFDHPRVAEGHPLRPHVLYRISRTTSDASLSSRSPR